MGDYEDYVEEKQLKRKNAGKQPASELQLQAWYAMAAQYRTQKGGLELDEARPDSVKSFWKSEDGKLTRKYRMGPIGLMDEALAAKNFPVYDAMRSKLVKKLRQDTLVDGGPEGQVLIKAGEIPPPRFATNITTSSYRTTTETTRRGCALGVLGLPCKHPVGSKECNGGVKTMRRIGDHA